MKVGLIGLGHMGLNLVKNMRAHGHDVVAWNRSPERREVAKAESDAFIVDTLEELVANLTNQGEQAQIESGQGEKRIIFSVISAGPGVDSLLSSLTPLLGEGDIVLDLANSHYKDSVRRAGELKTSGIVLLDCGISGGVEGARNGACMMVGGDKASYDYVEQILRDVCTPEGLGHFGESGAGHFVKMAHNGIEYGMMQVISEGLTLLHEKQEYPQDMQKLLNVWNHGSIIQSRLIGFLKEAYASDPQLANEESEIGSLGTGKWVIEEALNLGVPITGIQHAVSERYSSRFKNFIGWRVVSAMRRVFGNHSGSERSYDEYAR